MFSDPDFGFGGFGSRILIDPDPELKFVSSPGSTAL
jgi:hypothetical protein